MKYALCRKGNSWMATPNIKRILRPVLVLTAALYTLALCAGCSRLPEVTLDQLMDQVNAAHQAVNNDGLSKQFIPRQPVDENGNLIRMQTYYTSPEDVQPYDPDLVLTRQQMEEDVVYLFDAFYACYGNYDKMGGKIIFDKAERAVLKECARHDSLRTEDFQQMLLPYFTFVKDAHFQIQNQSPNPLWYPFFFREVAFYLDEDQYITADRKTVASVDGYDDLSQLFRRSISPEGEIVYYPVVLQDTTTWDEPLIVHYTDGSTQVLRCEPYSWGEGIGKVDQDAVPEVHYDDDIPVLLVNAIRGETVEGWQEGFDQGAKVLGNAPVGILDLRFNPGGYGDVAMGWLKDYAKTVVPTNSLFFFFNSESQQTNTRDLWVSNDNLLVILTSKWTASGSEWLIDAAHNLENVLIVGENTGGALIGGSAPVQLPNSRLSVTIGPSQTIIPDTNDYFEEFRGFCPDLWVPADEAEDLVLALLARQAKDPA